MKRRWTLLCEWGQITRKCKLHTFSPLVDDNTRELVRVWIGYVCVCVCVCFFGGVSGHEVFET
jgi:hypothetical protein